jgi:hypothetical protein
MICSDLLRYVVPEGPSLGCVEGKKGVTHASMDDLRRAQNTLCTPTPKEGLYLWRRIGRSQKRTWIKEPILFPHHKEKRNFAKFFFKAKTSKVRPPLLSRGRVRGPPSTHNNRNFCLPFAVLATANLRVWILKGGLRETLKVGLKGEGAAPTKEYPEGTYTYLVDPASSHMLV